MQEYDLLFDITKRPSEQQSQQLIIGRVGDGGLNYAIVKAIRGAVDYDLTGITPQFEGEKPDGEKIIDRDHFTLLNPQAGIFRFVFPEQAFQKKGTFKQAFFKFYKEDLAISTLEFQIEVMENEVEIGLNSTTYLSEYDRLIQSLTDRFVQATQSLEEQFAQYEETLKKMNTDYAKSIEDEQTQLTKLSEESALIAEQIKTQNIVTKEEFENRLVKFNNVAMIGQTKGAED